MSEKIVFLDRDGVINEFPGNGNYVTKLKEFHFIPGSLEALKRLKDHGFTVFVVSNQAGVGKGIYSQDKLDRITERMHKVVNASGGQIKKAFYCTHTTQEGCDCRKPGIGSIKAALSMMKKPIGDAVKAYFVGDTEVDVTAGKNAGCKTIFVLSGMNDRDVVSTWKVRPDYTVKDLLAATDIIIQNGHKKSKRQKV
ncbi:MAG: HAD family hydrolase [Candidatus Omnitrophica bacterium]|nr:HAD family hydrolase [Candidatus Omnitrophota bacterium]